MIYLDVETRSGASLTSDGLCRYVQDKNFKVICLVWYDSERDFTINFNYATYDYFLLYLKKYYSHSTITIVAHNASFEYSVLNVFNFNSFLKKCNITVYFKCTMAKAMACGLPASLDMLSKFLNTENRKLDTGTDLIKRYSIPKDDGTFNKITEKAHKDFYTYCKADVLVMRNIDSVLSENKDDKRFLLSTLEMNKNGLPVDVGLATKVLLALAKEKPKSEINIRSPKQVIEFCKIYGIELQNCQQQTIKSMLAKTDLPGIVRDILIERQGVKSSVAKYKKILGLERCGRLHDLFIYYGAHTGRDSARQFQPQNLPRGNAICSILLDDIDKPSWLELCGYSVPEVAKNGLRSIIRVSDNSRLLCADFSSIELRVLLWLSGDTDRLRALDAGEDTYKVFAARIFGVRYDEVTDTQRHLGKQVFLGLGYGLGKRSLGRILSETMPVGKALPLAARMVTLYRQDYTHVMRLWKVFGQALSRKFQLKTPYHVSFIKLKHCIYGISLPSGRYKLYYKVHKHEGDYSYVSIRTPQSLTTRLETGILINGHQFYRHKLYPGRLVNHVVQSIARDLLFDACVRLSEQGYKLIARVHDEVLVQTTPGANSFEDFMKLVKATNTERYPGLLLDAEGWEGKYYHK